MTTETNTMPALTGTWVADKAHMKIGFLAKHLMVTRVRGHFEDYDLTVEVADDLTDSKIDVTLDAASITTGTADRDNHIRSADFLDAENFPTLRFVSTGITRDGDDFEVTGDLTIREVTRPVTLDVVYEGLATDPWGNDHIGFTAKTVLAREDWDLTWNAALEGGGWLVSKEVIIDIEGELIRK